MDEIRAQMAEWQGYVIFSNCRCIYIVDVYNQTQNKTK